MKATLNIGLFVAGTKTMFPAGETIFALRTETELQPLRAKVARPKTGIEPTVVLELPRPLTHAEGNRLAFRLRQDAIAQLREDGVGELFGPRCHEWEPFDKSLFTTFEEEA